MMEIVLKIMENLIRLFLLPINSCIGFPFLAFVPAVIFALLFIKKRKRIKDAKIAFKYWQILVTALLWAVYGLYEYYMQIKYPPYTVPIRVDLLLIAPILYSFTTGALIVFFKKKER